MTPTTWIARRDWSRYCSTECALSPSAERLQFCAGDLTDPDVVALIDEHVTGMRSQSPPDSTHVLAFDALRTPDVQLWTAWSDGRLAGCGALKRLDSANAEIKSMRVRSDHLRKGVGRAILNHLVDEARAQGVTDLWLETGSGEHFVAARTMYERAGFAYCEPFADYRVDRESVFMTRPL
jgi:putative acetyltransferase